MATNPNKSQALVADKNSNAMLSDQQAHIADVAAVTTVGANTGTPAAGLSLIGNTTSVDQAAALMNDFASIQGDLVELKTKLDAVIAVLEAHGLKADA